MTVWDALDLRRHALIEASAGTGKTYTIERIVVRLLRERDDLALDRLLVVTFTEKATGELKERVRALVEKALAEESDPRCRARLQAAADGFDTAAISTIHAFCARLLREYAFENRQPFDIRLGAERELAEAAVRCVLRRDAPRHFGTSFQDALRRAADGPTGRWADDLAALLSQYRGPPWDVLLEGGGEDPVAELTAALSSLRKTFGTRAGAPLQPGDWSRRYGLLNIHAGSRKAALPVVDAIEGWFLDPAADAAPVPTFLDTLEALGTIDWFTRRDLRFAALAPSKWTGRGSNLDEVFPELPALAGALDALAPAVRRYRHALSLYVLEQARHELEQAKAREGLVTFDDLIRRLWEAIRPDNPNAESFVAALRKHFQVAIVDEFQDTDPIQWRIFHRLFVEPPAEGQLLVVGDPKQAIYAFRGADVRTYLHARDVLLAHNAQRLSLSVTYRCIPELVRAFNAFFGIPGWFPDAQGGIGYEPVREPPEGNARLGVMADRTGRAPVVRVALDGRADAEEEAGKASADRLRIELAGFVADEIATLLADPEAFLRVDPACPGGNGRPLRPEDLCILVQSRATAARIERALQQRRIPYTVYKQPGLYASDEADCILDMLRFLVRPADDSALRRVLLGPFFAVPAAAVETHPGLADPHVQDLAGLLQSCCEHRQWGRLCDALLYDTGFWARAADTPEGERRLATMRQILDELQAASGAEITDVAGLEERLLQLREEAGSAETGLDLRRRDSDTGRVRVMTMHAAKGLEFPIVFIADGFAGSTRIDTGNAYHWVPLPAPDPAPGSGRPDAPPRAISFEAGSAEVRAQQTADRQSELERLYYVALTRAQYRLYIPWTDSGLGASLQSSPLALLLMPALEALEQRHPELLATVPFDAWHGQPPPTLPPAPAQPVAAPTEQDDALPIWIPAGREPRRLRLLSFSSLARHGDPRPDAWTALEVTGERSDEPQLTAAEVRDERAAVGGDPADGPPEPADGTPQPSPLPPGNAVGKAFHDLMEALCEPSGPGAPGFEAARAVTTAERFHETDGVATLVDAALRRHAVTQIRDTDPDPDAAGRALAAMAWRALHTPLTPGGLRLCDVPRDDRRAEVEFLVTPAAALGGAAPPRENALLTGFIDLVFRFDGRYYILDWKTNTLDRYDTEAVHAAMQECDYGLQYQLYTLTLREWLRSTLHDFRDEHLGGVFYFFVRGGPAGAGGPVAVFSEPWSEERLRLYREAVRRRMQDDAAFPAADGGGRTP